MKAQNSLNAYIVQSLKENAELPALTDLGGTNLLYKDVAVDIAKLHLILEHAGIKRGDKIAICSRNSAHWAVAALAILTYGAVAVPILNDFKPDTIHHLVSDSESRLLFTSGTQWANLDPSFMPHVEGVIRLKDYSLLYSKNKRLDNAVANINVLFGTRYPNSFSADKLYIYKPEREDDLALINYTSGSSGFSKGVMLSYKNLWSNIQFAIDGLTFLQPGDGMVCMLPLAHMYGLVVEMLHPFVKGCHINFLSRTPSPRVIMEAFERVKPKLVVTVPLILEKIITTKVFPKIQKPFMKVLLHTPFIKDKIYAKIHDQLINVFGGQLKETIIGGAAINKDVEAFLRKIKFPFTVGYGMTECAPLVAYAPWSIQKSKSCGKLAPRMQARIRSNDPVNIPGNLELKGDNVMLGYYKNPKATAEVFTKDGWLDTGDICCIDSDGYIYIRGRDKNMILGPSGQNIYPEEIEQRVNSLPIVSESLVIDDGEGKLAVLIYPDLEFAKTQSIEVSNIPSLIDEQVKLLNKDLPAYSQLKRIKIMNEEFEKTPKRSIKRFLYQHNS